MSQNSAFDKLISLLKELFQLDQPDLDFGLYRIMHARADEISQFLDSDLLPQVKEAFKQYRSADKSELENELKKAIDQAKGLGVDPETTAKVKELRQKVAEQAVDVDGLEQEVYDHLYKFFRRYYDEGDFLAKRVYKPGVYAIPYEGEEVKLYWANKDQYYIKTSEYLRDYTFTLKPGANDPMRVHFRLVDAAEGEHGNVKEGEGKNRVFILAGEDFIAEEDGENGKELVISFEYRPATLSDWSVEGKANATAAAKKKPPTQNNLREDAVRRVLAVKEERLKPWLAELAKQYIKSDGDSADYSCLAAHLNRYTARNTFDYFIHKDLGSFLRRELDFYIKNEIMHLDDIESETAPRVDQYLSKIKVIRRIAAKIIDFLAQLENFQKKLWLKKKFIVDTNWCMTLDYVPEKFYEEIIENDKQRQEWLSLYSIGELKSYSEPLTKEFLKENPNLVLDTQNFDNNFVQRLISNINIADGYSLAIKGDNFHGLKVIEKQYSGKVKSIYLDPPYNTAVSAIPYKNNYKHSSWATMMRDRLQLTQIIMSDDAACYVSIDKNERSSLEAALNDAFGNENKIEELIWVQNTNDGRAPAFSTNHEYVLVYAKDRKTVESQYSMFREPKPGYEEVQLLLAELDQEYPSIEEIEKKLSDLYADLRQNQRDEVEAQGLDWKVEKRNDPYKGIYPYKHAEYRDKNGKYVPVEEARKRRARIWVYRESDWTIMESDRKQSQTTKDPDHPNYRYYHPIHPITGKPCAMPARGWKGTEYIDPKYPQRNSWESLVADHRIAFGKDESKVPQQKRFLHEVETNVSKSVIVDYSDGEKETAAYFGRAGVFLAPKHSSFVARFIRQSADNDSVIVDYFGGSGSTPDAVLGTNRADSGKRKFIVMEANDYFDEIIIPRLKKSLYAEQWSKGKPVHKGAHISHLIKKLYLESYEDTLNNLELHRNKTQNDLLRSQEAQGADGLREQYLLRYLLDSETRGSSSMLDVGAFTDPTAYKLKVKRPGGEEIREVNVDLLETFNWLIGLAIEIVASPQSVTARFSEDDDPDLPKDSPRRLLLEGRIREADNGPWWFRTVAGKTPDGRKTLVIWRKLTGKPEQDNLVLDEWFKKQGYSSKDSEFDLIYVNGDNNLENLRQPDDTWKVRLIEEDFHRLMFEESDS